MRMKNDNLWYKVGGKFLALCYRIDTVVIHGLLNIWDKDVWRKMIMCGYKVAWKFYELSVSVEDPVSSPSTSVFVM
jgi:hypothetical protein